MKAYNFRFEESEVNTWRECAVKSGLTLSEWIRKVCRAMSADLDSSIAEGARDVVKSLTEEDFCKPGNNE